MRVKSVSRCILVFAAGIQFGIRAGIYWYRVLGGWVLLMDDG